MSDYKQLASRLRAALATDGVEVSHSRALELVAAQHGYRDWNTLVAAPDAAGHAVVVPILRVFPGGEATRFYRDFLGFTIDWEHRFEPGLPLYLQVSRAGCVLHLSEHHGDAAPGSALRIEVDDVDALQRQVRDSDVYPLRIGLDRQPWGDDLQIPDPFGNRLIFHTPRRSE
ncbi:glyoxalase superfamily protein [Branchiibius cervicis]|uniref:Bleomycin resistance protein n=1 Tax=Branchiibius cervicis TaxID=908252 RepID=A0ABW2AQ87_9MICO